MIESPSVYLCGPFDYYHDPFNWRWDIERDYDWINWVNPSDKFPEYTSGNKQEVVDWCLGKAAECDFLFLRWDEQTVTVGTFMEYGIALENDTEIVCWWIGDYSPSPFIECTASLISLEADECVSYIAKRAEGII